jgi:hypothetical protein
MKGKKVDRVANLQGVQTQRAQNPQSLHHVAGHLKAKHSA